MMDAVVGGKCDNGCSKACSSQCKHACATSVTWERNFPESGKHFPECGMEMPNGIRTHQEIPARERRACIQTFACYMAGFSVIPIRESCTTYYRILYYLLQNPVLPIRENCNTYLRILWHISEKACHMAGRTAAHGFPPHTAVYIFQSPYILLLLSDKI